MLLALLPRLQLLTKFFLGTIIAAVYVPYPYLIHDVFVFLIKNIESYVINGFEDDESVCGEVQSDGNDACSVVEENGGNDDGIGPGETNGFVKIGESEPDEGHND